VQTPFSQVTCSHGSAGLQAVTSLPQHCWQRPSPQQVNPPEQMLSQLPPQSALVGTHFSPQHVSPCEQYVSQPPQSELGETQVPLQQMAVQPAPVVPEIGV
jgi:hypothetical protein